ncbi:hypothetical protein L198_02376 [Cryptococcus wingfieldii CBS 7118]|uniref:F-box domain-containing protein n=1 Tax=Cryptococcus wingfieldii CBS 7118 TaxID=1295528 RepID=A0A1E3JRL8_9TREE|nr:hypothetical protein L198_02376 [Cryptococcus wingfieldii CBS 7118]ODO03528.1 hypothetical protein L198_02376 [Cryptococcus wingfieldii CBS 7118]
MTGAPPSHKSVGPLVTGHRLDTLPDDVLIIILRDLGLAELVNLRRVNRVILNRIDHLGIPLYLASHRLSHLTLSPFPTQWLPYNLAKYNHQISTRLISRQWHALQIGRTWSQSVIPTLYLDAEQSRLVLGVGGDVVIHPLYRPHHRMGGKVVGQGRGYPIRSAEAGSKSDVVSIVDLKDGQGSLAIAQFDGTIRRFSFPDDPHSPPKVTAHYPHSSTRSTRVRKVVGSEKGDMMMSTSWDGQVSFLHTRSPWVQPTTMNVEGKVAWSSLLTTSHPSLPPTAMLGTKTAVSCHDILPSGPVETPARLLRGPDLPHTTSPYDIQLPPPSSSHNPNILLSAWYDSHLRLHDLRSSSASPIMTFQDPFTWADSSAFYSCCFTGENWLAGGGARHGTVAFFDIRNSTRGWSCFSPGGKGSPAYSLQGEGGKVWGVTEKRAFVLAYDGSGDIHEGLVANEARAAPQNQRDRGRHAPNGYRGRGGKWNWTVRYDADEGNKAVGYEHTDREIKMFDSLVAR